MFSSNGINTDSSYQMPMIPLANSSQKPWESEDGRLSSQTLEPMNYTPKLQSWEFKYREEKFIKLCVKHFDKLVHKDGNDSRQLEKCGVQDLEFNYLALKRSYPISSKKRAEVEGIFKDAANILQMTEKIAVKLIANADVRKDKEKKEEEKTSLEELRNEVFSFLGKLNDYLDENCIPTFTFWAILAAFLTMFVSIIDFCMVTANVELRKRSIITTGINSGVGFIALCIALFKLRAQHQVNLVTKLKNEIFSESLWIEGFDSRLKNIEIFSELKQTELKASSRFA